MECPICYYPFKAPIHQCVTGHSFCSNCTKKLAKCPTCAMEMTRTRNFTLELVLEEVIMVACPNFDKGCRERLFQEEILTHQSICEYQTYICPMQFIGICNWSDNKKELYQHIEEKHHWNTQNRFFMHWTADDPQNPMSFHFLYDKMFYFCRLMKNQTLYWVVQYIGSAVDASNYSYILVIARKRSSKQKLVISQTCFDDSSTPEDIIDAGLCVGVPINTLKPYCAPNEKFLCSIEVKSHCKVIENKTHL